MVVEPNNPRREGCIDFGVEQRGGATRAQVDLVWKPPACAVGDDHELPVRPQRLLECLAFDQDSNVGRLGSRSPVEDAQLGVVPSHVRVRPGDERDVAVPIGSRRADEIRTTEDEFDRPRAEFNGDHVISGLGFAVDVLFSDREEVCLFGMYDQVGVA